MSNSNLLDAIRVVKENEMLAFTSYSYAVQQINDSLGKMLFEQLAEFEKFHYEQLTSLVISLEKKDDFIEYEGKEFPLPPVFEIKAAQEPGTKSIISIVSEAIGLEKQAEKAYADLAGQITDPKGHQMFRRLSEEEHKHFRLLTDAYWSLNNLGVWKWSYP